MGDPSRWAGERDLEWIGLRPELVVEVTFDHTSNERIRHGDQALALARGQAAGGVPDGPAAPIGDRKEPVRRRRHGCRRGYTIRRAAACDCALSSSLWDRKCCRRSKCSRACWQVAAVLHPPARQRHERRQQVLAERGQVVLDARRHARVDAPLDEAVALELAQRRAEHAPGHTVDLPQQLVEAVRAGRQPRQHDDAPLRRQHADRRLERLECVLIVRRDGSCRHGQRGWHGRTPSVSGDNRPL